MGAATHDGNALTCLANMQHSDPCADDASTLPSNREAVCPRLPSPCAMRWHVATTLAEPNAVQHFSEGIVLSEFHTLKFRYENNRNDFLEKPCLIVSEFLPNA